MTINNGDILQAVVDFVSAGGLHEQNKFSFLAQLASGQSEAVVALAIASALEALYDNLNADVSTVWNDPEVYIDKVEWVTDHWEVTENVAETALDTSFNNATEPSPLHAPAYFVGRTARPRSRGRKWMPSFCEDRMGSGALIGAAITDLTAAAADYIDTIDMGGGNSLVPGVPSTVTGTFLPFVGAIVGTIVGSQRRRRQGYGI